MEFLLLFSVAFIASALSGMGVGGGGLLMIGLTLVCHMETYSARGVNLLCFALSATVALFFHLRRYRVGRQDVLALLLPAIPGTVLGYYLSWMLTGDGLRRLFGGFLLLSGLWALLPSKKG